MSDKKHDPTDDMLTRVFGKMEKAMGEEHAKNVKAPKKYDVKRGHYVRDIPLDKQDD